MTTTTHAPHVACWYCEDGHWIIDETKRVGDKDRLKPCPVCKWVEAHRLKIVSLANDWTVFMEQKTFDRFDLSAPEVQLGFDASRYFAEHITVAWEKRRGGQPIKMPFDAPWALTLYGAFGTGKTYLAAAIANAVRAAGVPVLFCYSANLWPYLGCITNPDPEEGYEGRLMAVMQVPVLILDEIGGSIDSAGRGTGVTESAFGKRHRIIEYRYSRRLPTIFLDQRHPKFWGDGAIASRIAEDGNDCLPHGADDYRNKGQREAEQEAIWDRGEGEQ